jgi:choline-sulfatase
MSPEAIQVARAYYFGLVTFQDCCFGQVLDYLDATDQRDNTIIVYLTDHGDLRGDFGCFFKTNMLDGSVRVPSIWSGPGIEQHNGPHSALIGLHDIFPTIAHMAGAPLDQPVHGRDMSPVLAGTSSGVRDVIVSETGGEGDRQLMACDGRWKYIYSEINGFEELYDAESDPFEESNVASDVPDQIARLRKNLIEWCRETDFASMLDGNDLRKVERDVAPEDFKGGSFGWRWY